MSKHLTLRAYAGTASFPHCRDCTATADLVDPLLNFHGSGAHPYLGTLMVGFYDYGIMFL